MASSTLLGGLLTTPAMAALFGDEARLQAMLDFEAALAGAEAECGVIPATAAERIAEQCRAGRLDAEALARSVAASGNPAIPLVKQLTALVAGQDAEAARFVHWGATSQDAIDTGTVLQLRAGAGLLDAELLRLIAGLSALARAHADTVMPGRTWLQHALPVTFGLKAAGWLSAVGQARERLRTTAREAAVLQFGGAAGTLASLGDRGLAVASALARRMELTLPALPWHTDRTRLVSVASALGILCGTLGKIARDIALLMQTDVAEAFEPAASGKGGSSTMPHKRNPVGCAVALAASVQAPGLVATMLAAMPQEHERGLGGWQAEWQTLPALFGLAAASLGQIADVAAGLEVRRERMRGNLDETNGLVMAEAVSMALAEHVGKAQAHAAIEAASRQAVATNRSLRAVLLEEERVTVHLAPARIEQLLSPDSYLGMTEQFIDRALRQHATME
jgi:3-carboxy-cis,cis-muconate cycloisomerase